MKKYLLELKTYSKNETYMDRTPILKSTKYIRTNDIGYLRNKHEEEERKAIYNNCYVEYTLFENNVQIANSDNDIWYDKRDNKIWIS